VKTLDGVKAQEKAAFESLVANKEALPKAKAAYESFTGSGYTGFFNDVKSSSLSMLNKGDDGKGNKIDAKALYKELK